MRNILVVVIMWEVNYICFATQFFEKRSRQCSLSVEEFLKRQQSTTTPKKGWGKLTRQQGLVDMHRFRKNSQYATPRSLLSSSLTTMPTYEQLPRNRHLSNCRRDASQSSRSHQLTTLSQRNCVIWITFPAPVPPAIPSVINGFVIVLAEGINIRYV